MTNGKNGHGPKDRLDRIEELLNMAALQTAENARQLNRNAKQLEKYAAEHNREMKQVRTELKNMIKRIAL